MRWTVAFVLNVFWGIAVESVSDLNLLSLAILVIGSLIISFKLAPAIAVLLEDWAEAIADNDDFYF
jgi:hypothetical protein